MFKVQQWAYLLMSYHAELLMCRAELDWGLYVTTSRASPYECNSERGNIIVSYRCDLLDTGNAQKDRNVVRSLGH